MAGNPAENQERALSFDLRWLLANKKAAYEFLREYVGLEIAAKLRNLRETHDLTQDELAGLLETTQPAVARWENEDYRKYSLATLQKIAEVFGLWPTIRFESYEAVVERILAGRDWASQDRSPVLHIEAVKYPWNRAELTTDEVVEAAGPSVDWSELTAREAVAVA